MGQFFSGFGVLAIITIALSTIPAWLTHVVGTLIAIADGKGNALAEVGVLLVGALIPPVGVIHGWMMWFGVGWLT